MNDKNKIISILKQMIKDYPQVYAQIRLDAEIQTKPLSQIENELEFEMNLYENVPELLKRNYETVDHFLDYIIEVKKYRKSIDETPDFKPDF